MSIAVAMVEAAGVQQGVRPWNGKSMDSLIFALTIIFVGYVVFWSIKNDKANSISEQRGLLRMQNHEKPDKASSGEARSENRERQGSH